MTRRPTWRAEGGETLVELMVTIAILGIAVVAVVGGIAASIKISDYHRKQANSLVFARAYAEAVEKSIAATPTGYVACPTAPTYSSAYSLPAAATSTYQADAATVEYWNSATSTFGACPGTGDQGVQRVTVRVHSLDGRASEQLQVIIRRPCRTSEALCT